MNPKELRAKRATIIENARSVYFKIEKPTAEDNAAFDAAMVDGDAIKAQYERIERARDLEAELAGAAYQAGRSVDEVVDDKAREQRFVLAYLRNDVSNMSERDQTAFAARIKNAASVGTTTAGGFTVAPDFMRELLVAEKAFGGMRAAARVIPTESGVDLPWPTMDDTANVATIVNENTTGVAGTDLVFGSKTLKAWTYRSGFLPISIELMQDSAFPFDTLIRDAIATRFARGQNTHFTTGNGTTQPQGVITGAAVGATGATGQTLTVTYDDFVELEHSIDPAYRPGSRFMFHDSTLKVIRKLKDSQNRPLWLRTLDGLASGTPDTIADFPYTINQDMPVMAANAKSILFGNFSNYMIRDVLGLRILRLNERFAENGQVAFVAFQRTDGRLVSAGVPVKWYANSAT